MLQLQHDTDNLLKVKILDFGLAKRLDSEGFRKDIGEVVRLFVAIYTGLDRDLSNNWRTELDEVSVI